MTTFRAFGASSLDFSLLFWTHDIDDRLAVESEARMRVLAALRNGGVDIPFPRMDLRVRDGVLPPPATSGQEPPAPPA
jgi:small-conductance mechanosensitive channel